MKNFLNKLFSILPLIAFASSIVLCFSHLNSNPDAAAAWSCSSIWAGLYYFSKK